MERWGREYYFVIIPKPIIEASDWQQDKELEVRTEIRNKKQVVVLEPVEEQHWVYQR